MIVKNFCAKIPVVKRSELKIQIEFFKLIRSPAIINTHPVMRWIHKVPNDGKRNKISGAIAVMAGLTKGVWDIFVPWRSNRFCGLYIEMKCPGKKLTDEQIVFRDSLQTMYSFKVAFNEWEAFDFVMEYIGMQEKKYYARINGNDR
jgi:hypothetical protein